MGGLSAPVLVVSAWTQTRRDLRREGGLVKKQQAEGNLVMGFSCSKKSSVPSLGISLRYLRSVCQENEIIPKKLKLIKALYKTKL